MKTSYGVHKESISVANPPKHGNVQGSRLNAGGDMAYKGKRTGKKGGKKGY